MSAFKKGQRVYHYYTCEPAFIYGSGKVREEGTILSDGSFECNGEEYYAVKWDHQYHPSLDFAKQIRPMEEQPQ